MKNMTVIGTQWGDEGKGKIVDYLAAKADLVVRFQGGHNAGHTLVVGEKVYKLHLLPSGLVRGKLSVIGNGVVLDPLALVREMETLTTQGLSITPQTLLISDQATLILPFHGETDRARETAKGSGKIGTTGRGIGPAYEDKAGRRALRAGDLCDPATLGAKIDAARAQAGSPDTTETKAMRDDIVAAAARIAPFVAPSWKRLQTARKKEEIILFEGAQGVMLDVDHGTYPFVTSSNTIAPQAATGSGAHLSQIGYVLGITKAYTTRVGSGPFPTELQDEAGETLGQRGHEFGTTTGRKRRCGWFDAVQVRQAVHVGGVDGLALMKLDVMDTLAEIKICVAYDLGGERIDHLPSCPQQQAAVTPVYETLPGWQSELRGKRKLSDLPAAARRYVDRLAELTEISIDLISTSPEREDTIMIKNI